MPREQFIAMSKLKYRLTITSSILNYITKADAKLKRAQLRVQNAESVTY